jgi:hypothetical protein
MGLNNPITSLAQGVLQSPNIGSTILGSIPSISLVSPRNVFLQQMESWVSAIPMSTQWVVLFDDFPIPLKQEVLGKLEPAGDGRGWNIDISKKVLTSYVYQKLIGCVFAQGFQAPRQSVDARNDENYRGFLGAPISYNRVKNEPLNLTFLETNASFVDTVIRPWSILTSHLGLIARPKEQNIKTNITILQYTRTNQALSQIPRKIWTFYNACPISIPGNSYDYSNESVEKQSNIKFIYSHYQVSNSTYIPIPDLIEKFSNGGIREILGASTIGRSINKIRDNPLAAVGGILGNAVGGAIAGI